MAQVVILAGGPASSMDRTILGAYGCKESIRIGGSTLIALVAQTALKFVKDKDKVKVGDKVEDNVKDNVVKNSISILIAAKKSNFESIKKSLSESEEWSMVNEKDAILQSTSEPSVRLKVLITSEEGTWQALKDCKQELTEKERILVFPGDMIFSVGELENLWNASSHSTITAGVFRADPQVPAESSASRLLLATAKSSIPNLMFAAYWRMYGAVASSATVEIEPIDIIRAGDIGTTFEFEETGIYVCNGIELQTLLDDPRCDSLESFSEDVVAFNSHNNSDSRWGVAVYTLSTKGQRIKTHDVYRKFCIANASTSNATANAAPATAPATANAATAAPAAAPAAPSSSPNVKTHVECHESADVKNSEIGNNVIIEKGCKIDGCLIKDGSKIGEGSILKNSIILPNSNIANNSKLNNQIKSSA